MNKRTLLLLTIVFVVLNALFIVFAARLAAANVDNEVLIVTNLLLYILSILTHFMQVNALKNKNPQVFVRTVMAGTMIKLFVLATAVLIYLVVAKENRNIPAVFGAMIVYVVYMIIDTRSSLSLNKSRNVRN